MFEIKAASMSNELIMPNGFPDRTLTTIKGLVCPKLQQEDLNNFLGAENGIRYRFRACADYSGSWTNSFRMHGDAPPMPERYHQDHTLYGFFLSGQSVLDSFSFFLYFLASTLNQAHFPTNDPNQYWKINCKFIADKFEAAYPEEEITVALLALVTNHEFKQWSIFRNILAHRAAPGRKLNMGSNPGSLIPPSTWNIDPSGETFFDDTLTEFRLAWLLDTLVAMLDATEQFASKQIKAEALAINVDPPS
jgi:hypothetical protein